MAAPQSALGLPKPSEYQLPGYELWKKRWHNKLSDSSRPSTPAPDTKAQLPPFVPVQLPKTVVDKLTALRAEGVYQPFLTCPTCRSSDNVFDDAQQGCTLCRACGFILCNTLITNEPEIEYDRTKDKDDTAFCVLGNLDNDSKAKPWLPELQTDVQNQGRVWSGYAALRLTHSSMETKKTDVNELLYKHSAEHDAERLRMLAKRNAELKTWLDASQLKPDAIQARIAALQERLAKAIPGQKLLNKGGIVTAPDATAEISTELKQWQTASTKTPTEVQQQIKELMLSVDFLTKEHLKAKLSPEEKKKLHEELAFRRFAHISKNLHNVTAFMFDAIPVKLLAKAQEYMKRFVELRDRRINSRDTWSCCCLQLAAMHDFGYMFNERELRARCSQPCKLKTLRKDIRIARKVLQLPQLSPVDLVQLNRTHLQRPFGGLGKCRGVLYTKHPLAHEEETKLDILFAVVLELAYACIIPKPAPFTRKVAAPASGGESAGNSSPQPIEEDELETAEDDPDDGADDADDADDIVNEPQQEQERKLGMLQLLQNNGPKRSRSASSEEDAKSEMPVNKKHQPEGRLKPKPIPKLGIVTEAEDAQTDGAAVLSFMKQVLIVLERLLHSNKVPDPAVLANAAKAWPAAIKNQVLAGLQRRAPRTIASALFYIGMQAMRSPSKRITIETVRMVAYVGAIPLRDCKAQLRDLLAFVLKQKNVQDLLASALYNYVRALNNSGGSGSSSSNNNNSADNGDKAVAMDVSSTAMLQQQKASAVAALTRCP